MRRMQNDWDDKGVCGNPKVPQGDDVVLESSVDQECQCLRCIYTVLYVYFEQDTTKAHRDIHNEQSSEAIYQQGISQ